MTAVEIAARTRLLVFIVMPDPGRPLREAYLENSPVGAAALLMADEAGYLLATNRHVAEPPIPFFKNHAERVLVVSSQGSYAYADVIARHQNLDLALLWIQRRSGRTSFRQPITHYPEMVVGSSVYVVGHPERLFFTLSSGLVSRVGGDSTVQLSAPISPGNSGGPAYDTFGNLLGLITFAVDKRTTPNAENLNFATRADAFLTETGWNFRGEGKGMLKRFFQQDPNRER
ncbi:MAG: trypsin-like peptidase domain-containing protein [Acidobacteria bacterium]|nr:trypsin-like peptidase domain-containing protein [Acidobacteriota bacterium]